MVRGVAFAGWGVFCLVLAQGQCQSAALTNPVSAPVDPAVSRLLDSAGAEQKRGTFLFYSQSCIDSENKPATYRGSLYGVLRDVKVDGCTLLARVEIVDAFSGMVGGQPTGKQQDWTESTVTMPLTQELRADVLEARPAELSRNRHTFCTEDQSCRFQWIRFSSGKAAIHMRTVVNGSLVFDGPTDHFLAPASSKRAGEELTGELRAVMEERCR